MNDELFYEKLATSIATSHSPFPRIHGVYVAVLNQLYPILLAPFFGAFDVPTAFHAAHVFNAVLMASAVIPAYLLAREVVSRSWSLTIGLLTIVMPWMVLSGALLTESVAYPAFLWAMFGLQRAIADPSQRHDLLAVGALALAVLARTQFVFLVAVLPAAVFTNQLACSPGRGWEKLRDAGRTAIRKHRLLAQLYVAGAVLLGVLAVFGSLGSALGTYAVTARGSPLPSGVWRALATHLDTIGIGCGLVPLVLGGGWLIAAVARPIDRRTHALATLCLLTIAAFVVETASFDTRFPGEVDVRDRYLFYVVPLLLLAAGAALAEGRRRSTVVAAAALTVVFAATAPLLEYTTPRYLVDAPARIFGDTLIKQSGALGAGAFVALAGLCLGLAVTFGLLLFPRRAFAVAVIVFLVPFAVLTTQAEVDRALGGTGLSGRPFAGPPGVTLDWVDAVLPAGATAAMVPFPTSPDFVATAVLFWDVEFWNGSIVRTYVASDGEFSYAPFPNQKLVPDWTTGLLAGTAKAPPFVLFATNDPRMVLAGPQHAENLGLRVILADRPYHASWMTRGLETDGWMGDGHPTTLRIYSPGGDNAQLVEVQITMAAVPQAPATYVIQAPGTTRSGEVAAATAKSEVLTVCTPAHSGVDITVTSRSSARIPNAPISLEVTGTRHVGVDLGPISTQAMSQPCTPLPAARS